MKNFAGKNRPDKKVWGVLGKQETFYSPEQFQDKGRIVPLNDNPFVPWDSERSRYIRRPQMPPMANDGQQAGVVGTGSEPTPTPTSSVTPTPSITPSSTPYPLPLQPALWYDSSNVGSIDYITSGGSNYVSAWRSVGTISKTLSGDSINTMPIWSGSSQLPGSPNIVRFTKNSNTALQDYLTQRFDSTPIPYSGLTVFEVFAKPDGYTYADTSNTLGFGYPFILASGNTTTGGYTSGTTPSFLVNISVNQAAGASNSITNQKREFAYVNNTSITNFSAATINSKFLYHVAMPYPTGSTYFEINQSGGTNTQTPITASTPNTVFNQVYLGRQWGNSGGTLTNINNAGAEVAEIMVFNRELTIQEQEQVQNYLRDKWRYDEWASPVPTPTPTYTPTSTATPTPSVTQTQTSTTTQTPSPTPSGAPASGTTEALIYLNRVVQSGGTVDATASAATITLFTSLVSNGLWDKIDAFYPTLGGVAASHTINGRVSGGTYDLTFNGGWTHSSSGMQPNGTNGYAETNFNPNTLIGNGNSSHLSIYVNLQGTVGDRIYDMGVATNSGGLSDMWNITAKRTSGAGNNTLFDAGTYSGGRVETTSQASASGMTVGSVRSTTDRVLYRNGSSIATSSTSQSITYGNRTQIIGAQKSELPVSYYSSNRYAFATMGRGLTNTDIVNLSSIINTYQTSLGRNTY